MKAQWLTVISITKDDPVGLDRTLESARLLRHAGCEHIVIDGGDKAISGTGESDILTIKRPAQGIADAFNAGLAIAQGEWIWFLNGADRVHESLDAEWLRRLLADSRADIVTGGIHFDGESAARSTPALAYQWPLSRCWIAHPATLVRRSFLQASGGFNPRWKVAMDYDFWLRSITQQTVIDVISRPLARFDVSGVSQNPHMRQTAKNEEARVVRVYGSLLVGAGLWTAARSIKRVISAVWGGGRSR